MTEQNAAFTGSIPEEYDKGLGPVLFQAYADRMARRAADYAPARVLETAAGTGMVTRRLRDLLAPASDLIATDLNDAMLDLARARFTDADRVGFRAADALALPFADGSFDMVVCQFGAMFFPDRDAGYREARRVLAPGGRFLFSVWDSHAYNRFAAIAHAVVGDLFAADPPQFYQVPFSCCEIDPIKRSLLAAGFGEIRIAVEPIEQPVQRLADFARGIVFGNPLVDQIRKRGGIEPDAVVAAVADALHREFGPDPARVSLQTISFDAVRD